MEKSIDSNGQNNGIDTKGKIFRKDCYGNIISKIYKKHKISFKDRLVDSNNRYYRLVEYHNVESLKEYNLLNTASEEVIETANKGSSCFFL